MNTTDILMKLPPVFDLRELQIVAGIDRKHASQMCWRLSNRDLIAPFAEGIYFNLLADRNASKTQIGQAINRTVSTYKIAIGASALNKAGWTTQMPRVLELALPVDRKHRTFKKMAGVVAAPRSVRWFRSMLAVSTNDGPNGLPVLPPAYALVDCFIDRQAFLALGREERKTEGSIWHPDPDDISIPDDPEQAFSEIMKAAEVLEAPLDELLNYLASIDELEPFVEQMQAKTPSI